MSGISLKMIEIENFGRFYDPARLEFDNVVSDIVMGASQGKTTFVNALECLSQLALNGSSKDIRWNFCKSCPENPKDFVRIEILLSIYGSSRNGLYRYGACITNVGVLSEYLLKENTGRRLFYRYKNDLDLYDYSDDIRQYVISNLRADVPVIYLLNVHKTGVHAQFIRFFERLWIVRAGGIKYKLSAQHLFKKSFFTRRSNIEACCDFMRLLDKSVTNFVKATAASKVSVIHKNSNGYEYPVSLFDESDSFIKFLLIFRAIDALSSYGGTLIVDVGDIALTSDVYDKIVLMCADHISIIIFSSNDILGQNR